MTVQILPDVRHNPARQRYEVEIDGKLSIVDYILEGKTMLITHTGVPPEQRGHGIAHHLVKAALEDAHARQLRVVPLCSFAAAFLRRYPEYRSAARS
jgi:predicted GNAT family acetyltransferase